MRTSDTQHSHTRAESQVIVLTCAILLPLNLLCLQAYLAAHLLALSDFPDKDSVCKQIRAHAKDPNQQDEEKETIVGGTGTAAAGAKGAKGKPEPLHIIIAGAPCSGQSDAAYELFS